MSDTIPLSDVIGALRAEILKAAEKASTKSVKFELGQLELEFQVVAKQEKGADGKLGARINFHIFSVDASLGGSGKLADERTQKVKFVLTPTIIDVASNTKRKIEISRRKRARES